MSTLTVEPGFYMPRAPRSEAETGVSRDMILQLVVKTLHFGGELTGAELASRLGVLFPVIESSLEFLKKERHCELGGGGLVGPSAYRYRLTDQGRGRARM